MKINSVILIIFSFAFLVGCSNNEEESDYVYTAASDYWSGYINIQVHEPENDVSESGTLELRYTGDEPTVNFNYEIHPEWMPDNYEYGEGSIRGDDDTWERNLNNYGFLGGYQYNQKLIVKLEWEEDGTNLTEELAFEEE